MSRFFALVVILGGTSAFGVLAVAACSEPSLEPTPTAIDAGQNLRRDSGLVDPAEAGAPLDAGTESTASCEKYCDLVVENCAGPNKQYDAKSECLAFCGHLPLEQQSRGGDLKTSASVACRQYWADSPSKTNPDGYCLAAGPFGGNICGDRCTAFCDAVLSACPATAANAPYPDAPSCASACAAFSYRDAGTDGGGEGPAGPSTGDSLNCRLHQLRAAIAQPGACSELRADSTTCKD